MFDLSDDQAQGLRKMMGTGFNLIHTRTSRLKTYENADDVIICMHTDAQSVKHAYQIMKRIKLSSQGALFKVYVCDAYTSRAERTFSNLCHVCSTYLGITPVLLGILPNIQNTEILSIENV